MMKILFFWLFSFFLIFCSKFYFWILGSTLVLLGLFFMTKNFMLTDYIFLAGGEIMDLLSFSLVILSLWISMLMYYSSRGIYSSQKHLMFFSFLVYLLCFVLFLTFTSFNLLFFYFYFEVSLIPTLLIILGWGYQPERLQAGIYFLFYTLTASLPFLLGIVYVYFELGNLDCFMHARNVKCEGAFYFFVILTAAFLVKMPMFFVHLWLPKAHVEAPVSGSMILAGILLKLGGYGFYRVLGLCQKGLSVYGSYFFGLSVLGMACVGFMCCRLNDLKALVAYSSVAHMGMVICGIYSMYIWGYAGGLMMMVSHGVASSGLFCIVNMYYERSGSRSMFLNSGLLLIFPVMTLFIFLLVGANMAAPPTINLLSEIFLMVSMIKYDLIMLLLFPLGSYMGAVFTLYLFSFSQHGKMYSFMYSFSCSTFREYHILFMHSFPVNVLILKSGYFLFLA